MLCLDTYALIELHDENPKFAFLLNKNFVITDLTLTEFFSMMYKKHDRKTADYWFEKLSSFSKLVSKDIMKKAALFKLKNNKQKLSFFDCVGYIYSLENNLKFVTGDKEFKNKKGVMFISK